MSTNKKYGFYRFFWKAIDVIYPPSCACCGREGVRFCDECRSQMVPMGTNICQICGDPLVIPGICDRCRKELPPFTALRSFAEYKGPLREALHSLKFKNNLALSDTFSEMLIPLIRDLNWNFDLVLPVPMSKAKKRSRGYNQAAQIAYPISLAFQVPFSDDIISRKFETKSQIGLGREERFKNIHNAFQGNSAKLLNKKVLLVDDITTTGATITSCARALQESGCERIYCITVAKTP